MDDLTILGGLLDDIAQKDVKENDAPKVIKIKKKNPKLQGYNQWKASKVKNPDIQNMSPDEMRRQVMQRESLIQNLMKPGALATGARARDERKFSMEKKMVADDYIKYVNSDRSPYHKWYVLHFYGRDQKKLNKPNPYQLERKFATENAKSLWNYLGNRYWTAKGTTGEQKKVLRQIVKHLKIPYFTQKLQELKLNTQVEFDDTPRAVEYTLDDTEREIRKSVGKYSANAHSEYVRQVDEWKGAHGSRTIIKAYLKYLEDNEPELHKMYFNKLATLNPRETRRFSSTLLRRLFWNYPEQMPEEFKPEILDTDVREKREREEQEREQQTRKRSIGSLLSGDEKRLKPEGLFDGSEEYESCVIFSDVIFSESEDSEDEQ